MCARDGLVPALQAIVGPEALLAEEAAAPYAIEGVAPKAVVFPEEEAQVAEVLRVADAHGASVFPRGGGSHMDLGYPPVQVDVVLCLERLSRHLAYVPADLTTTVQAGMRLADLQQRLRQEGQFLALDPPARELTTLGGMVAANLSGPRRLLYGTARDMVLGTAVITVEGKRAKAGGRVVKNVTGYDLNKLYIGSLGTLAVIVELTFKLYPLPPGEHTVGIAVAHHKDLLPILQALRQTPLRLNSLELLNGAAIDFLAARSGVPAPQTPYLVLARVEGTPAVTRQQQEKIATALRRLPLHRSCQLLTWEPAQQGRLWQEIEEFPSSVYAQAPQSAVCKVSVLMSALPALFATLQEAEGHAGQGWPALAHAGSGIAYVSLTAPPLADPVAELVQQLHAFDRQVTALGGYRVLLHAPVAVKQRCQVWGPPRDDFPLMQALKAAFDPRRRLNPGRFIGGL
ncbi:MAG: FAD-linked oxidase [Candidatus Tectimicrobiota bacterium]|nr:MAG: FAD-linked oxidase [Candidatus Tectomicrobia bacterium]